MERYVMEFEPRVKELFVNSNYKGLDLDDYMNKAMDLLEDIVAPTNTMSPRELLKTPKYNSFNRFIKDAGIFTPFTSIVKEYWDKTHLNK